MILGKNAAGKTTLLNLIAETARGLHYLPEEREITVESTHQDVNLKRTTSVKQSKMQTFLGAAQTTQEDVFELKFKGHATSISVKNGTVRIDGTETPVPGAQPLIAVLQTLTANNRAADARLLTEVAHTSASRLDEGLDYYHQLLKLVLTKRLESTNSTLAFATPESFFGLLNRPISAKDGAISNDQINFANEAARLMGYTSAAVRFDFELRSDGTTIETSLRTPRFHFKSGQSEFTNESLSYGERRLLAFLATNDASPSIVIVDELINGLHHHWIVECLSQLRGKQAFLTSQNPLLLDYLVFENAEDLQRGIIFCSRTETINGRTTSWRNPSEEEAADIFAAYEVGIQKLSDILINMGLW